MFKRLIKINILWLKQILFLFLLILAICITIIAVTYISIALFPTSLSTPLEINTADTISLEEAETIIMERREVKHFIAANEPEYSMLREAEDDGYYFEFHTTGNGTAPLWNWYRMDKRGNIIDMWLIYNRFGTLLCSKAAHHEWCDLEKPILATKDNAKPLTTTSICTELLEKLSLSENLDPVVREIYTGTPAPVNFDSLPEARLFRTHITNQATESADFAGHFKVAAWGCGTQCQGHAIIDQKTGNIISYEPHMKFKADGGIYSEVNSDILIFNPQSYYDHYYDEIS